LQIPTSQPGQQGVEATATDAAGSNSYSLIILLELMNQGNGQQRQQLLQEFGNNVCSNKI
jgi:hypothetical protein